MPYIRLETTETLRPEAKQLLCAQLSKLCADTIGKPEKYVQVAVLDGVALMHGGAPGRAAFVDIRSIGGLTPKVCQALSQKVCATLRGALNVSGARVYLNFTDVPAASWGHDGGTFG